MLCNGAALGPLCWLPCVFKLHLNCPFGRRGRLTSWLAARACVDPAPDVCGSARNASLFTSRSTMEAAGWTFSSSTNCMHAAGNAACNNCDLVGPDRSAYHLSCTHAVFLLQTCVRAACPTPRHAPTPNPFEFNQFLFCSPFLCAFARAQHARPHAVAGELVCMHFRTLVLYMLA